MLAIEGDVRVNPFSLTPRIHAERVTLDNADWGKHGPMLIAREIEFSISLVELLRGRVELPDVRLKSPVVLLQRDRDGRRNWILTPSRQATAPSPVIKSLKIDDGELEVLDAMSDTALRIDIGTTTDETYGIAFSARGRLKGVPLKASGTGGALLPLLDANTDYPLRLNAIVGATSIGLDGTIHGLATLHGLDAKFTIAGRNLATLSDPLHIVLPETAPYKLSGRLRREGHVWRLERFRGSVGRSDLEGDLSIDQGSARPFLRGTLKSTLLDIADLGGFVGAAPGTVASSNSGRVLPQKTYDLEKLRRADAEVDFVARRFTHRDRLPLDNLKAHLTLRDGVLQLTPLDFGVAGGNMKSTVWFDARSPQINARIDTRFQSLRINRLAPRAGMLDSALGTINGSARLAGTGNSVSAMLAVADGRVALVSSGGDISNLLLAIAGANGAKILRFLILGDRNARLHCAVAGFTVKRGVMASDVLVIDTSDTNITGKGTIDLRDESLELTLVPLPKNPSVLSLRGPLHVTGTLSEPSLSFDKPTMTLRAGSALLLALVNPLAGLLPLIETGPGKDSDCARLTGTAAAAAGKAGKAADHPRR
jgi:uncharacterized protein involved in outer membrane biogenesis